MDTNVLIAILSISIPLVNLFVPLVNNVIDKIFQNRKDEIEYSRSNKINCLNEFLNSLKDYSVNPTTENKHKCYICYINLHCYYTLRDNSDDFEYIFSGKNIDFDYIDELVRELKKQ